MQNCQYKNIPCAAAEVITLKLLKSHMDQSFSLASSEFSKPIYFYKHLKIRNIKMTRQRGQINYNKNQNRDNITHTKQSHKYIFNDIEIKVLDEMERIQLRLYQASVKRKMFDRRNNFKEGQQIKSILKTQSQIASKCISQHFEQIGWNDAAKLAKQLKMTEQNKQQINELICCFQHILNIDETIDLFNNKKEYRKVHSFNLQYYSDDIQEIILSKTSIKFIKEENKQQQEQNCIKVLKYSRNNLFFEYIKTKLTQNLYNHHSQELKIFKQRQTIQKYLQKQQKLCDNFLNKIDENDLWQKLCFLMRKAPKNHSLIAIHLQQFNHNDLLSYFRQIINGQNNKPFNKNLLLFNNNKYYKQFLLILERRYIQNYLNKLQQEPQEQLLAIALKQIYLKELFHQNFDAQLLFIKEYANDLHKQLKYKMNLKTNLQQIQKYLIKLLYLGQYCIVLDILLHYQKINLVEALLVIAILFKVDLKRSQLLLYDPAATLKLFQTLIKQSVLQVSTSNCHQYAELFSSFLPIVKNQLPNPQIFYIDVLTDSNILFQYIVQNKGYFLYCKDFGLSLKHLPLILNKLMQKHCNYSYCIQLGLSICVSLSRFYALCKSNNSTKSSRNSLSARNSTINCVKINGLDKYQIKGLVFINNSQEYQLSGEQKFDILISTIQKLLITNLQFINNPHNREHYYSEIYFCNQVLNCLSKSEYIQLIFHHLNIDQPQKQKFISKIQKYLKTLSFTFSHLKLRNSINYFRFQSLIDVFNNFIEQISPNFEQIIEHLQNLLDNKQGKRIGLAYLGELTQSIMLLKRQKSKVVLQNRNLFKIMCRQATQLLKTLRQVNREQVTLIESHLQKTLNQITNL